MRGFGWLPENVTVASSRELPVCEKYSYALHDDCFEIRVPYWADGEPEVRCRLPRPWPMRPWCVGEEGSAGPYRYYDPTGLDAPMEEALAMEGDLHHIDLHVGGRAELARLHEQAGYEVVREAVPQKGAAAVLRFGREGKWTFRKKNPDGSYVTTESAPEAPTLEPREPLVNPAVASAAELPLCKRRYVVGDDCFELDWPYAFDGSGHFRCRMQKPRPAGNWCLGGEGQHGPYRLYDPDGPVPEKTALSKAERTRSAAGLPVCDIHYALTGDCFELRRPFTEDGQREKRCKLPRPLPERAWCVGEEGLHAPYTYYDPAGRFGVKSENGSMQPVARDTQEKLRDCFKQLGAHGDYTAVWQPSKETAPEAVYAFGKKGKLEMKLGDGRVRPEAVLKLEMEEMYHLLPPELRDPKNAPKPGAAHICYDF